MRKMINSLTAEHAGYCGVFAGDNGENIRYVVSTGASGKDLKALQDILKNEFSARGGGNAKMIQGSIEKLDIDSLLNRLKSL